MAYTEFEILLVVPRA